VSALILDDPAMWDTTHIQWAYDHFTRCYELTSMGKTAAELREILGGTDDRLYAHYLSQLDPGPLEAFFDRSHWEGFEPDWSSSGSGIQCIEQRRSLSVSETIYRKGGTKITLPAVPETFCGPSVRS
jgi:hypothetical protein